MADYYDSDAIKKLRRLRELKPETFKAFTDFVAMAMGAGGAWAHSCIAMATLEKS